MSALAPDFIVRTGATPVSKPLQQYLDRHRDRLQILFAAPETWPDQGLSASQLLWGGESWSEVAGLEAFAHHAKRDGGRPDLAEWNQAGATPARPPGHHRVELARCQR
jgi:2-succinyl-5-enolpyruvyl-6-hydroxy-3-cyclohexene-1-carboxylate synthase